MKSGDNEHRPEPVQRKGTQELEEELIREFKKVTVKGFLVGFTAGLMDSVLEVLDARGLKMDAEARHRIETCKDAAQLKRWLRMVAKVESVHELFEASPTS
jgi:hypothetical protein